MVKRETAGASKNVTQIFDDTIESFKSGLEDLSKKIGVCMYGIFLHYCRKVDVVNSLIKMLF